MTMNSPDSMLELHRFASSAPDGIDAVTAANLMREVGLKCIGFNGVARTINCLGAFRAGLPGDVLDALPKETTRVPTKDNLDELTIRGRALWKSVYTPFDEKLLAKLSESHPDLPVHILNSHYGPLFSDPPARAAQPGQVGRILTSILAISCLRAQTGVGPQVLSHVFGLRKAFEQADAGSLKSEDLDMDPKREQWLRTDEGVEWILRSIDRIVESMAGEDGTTFAPIKSKL